MDQVVAALDVGGTSVKAALVDGEGRVLFSTRRATGVDAGPAAVVAGIVDLAAELCSGPVAAAQNLGGPADSGPISRSRVAAVGVVVPGTVDPVAGIARLAVNLGWQDVPLVALIEARTGLPVSLGHDVRTAALAEARLGAGAGDESMFFVSIGTGIAGGLVRGGVVEDGATGLSGEIGHLVVRPGGPACRCGNRGCLESLASASRISDRFAAATGRTESAETIAGLVRSGDPASRQVWGEAVDALADALAAATVLMDPARFVLGGGLSLAGATLMDPLLAAFADRMTFRAAPPISLTALGDRAGVLGAALRAGDQLADLRRRTAQVAG